MSNELRRYSDEEFAQVLHRALRLQEERASGRSRQGEGLTLEDIKAVGRDVGIDADLIDQAVALLAAPESTAATRWLGGPTRYRLEHSTAGVTTRDDLARVVDAIRAEAGHHGRVSTELDGITWETQGEPSQIHVSLFPGEDGTEVRLSVNRDAAFIMTWFMPVAGGMVLAGITGAAVEPSTFLGGAAIMGGGVAGGLTLARALWGRSTTILRQRAERVLGAVVRALSGPKQPSSLDAPDPPPSGAGPDRIP